MRELADDGEIDLKDYDVVEEMEEELGVDENEKRNLSVERK